LLCPELRTMHPLTQDYIEGFFLEYIFEGHERKSFRLTYDPTMLL
jgi:hypothetical protein